MRDLNQTLLVEKFSGVKKVKVKLERNYYKGKALMII